MSGNFSRIGLEAHKRRLKSIIANLYKSLNSLSDKTTDFAEHHQNSINAYNEMLNVCDNFIENSDCIGKGK